MRTTLLLAALGPAMLPLLAQDCGGPDEPTPTPPPPAEFVELSQSLEAEREAMGAPGLAFAWFRGADVPFAQGYGARYQNNGPSINPSTLFRIGSVNKMLTVAGVLQQVDAGLVDLDQSIGTSIPELEFALDPSWDDSIHVRHLLNHTGAFYDYLELDADPSDEALDPFITGWFAENIQVLAPAGRMWNYSNPNFYVAGLVTERASGEYYRPYLDANVFAPLGMDRTLFLGDEVLADGNYAAGFTSSWAAYGLTGPVVEPDSYDNGWARPAGFGWSTVLDLARFGQFLMNGNEAVLSEVSLDEMKRSQINMEIAGDLLHYGFGLFIHNGFFVGENFYDLTLIEHGGDIPGFAADIYLVPDLGFGFAALASADAAHLDDSVGIALELGGLPAPSEAPDLSPKPETFPDFVGRYVDPWNIVGPMEFSLVDGTLMVKMPLLDALRLPYQEELTPYTPDNFIITIQGYPMLLTFIRDADGRSEYARTRLFVAERDDAAGLAAGTTASAKRDGAKLTSDALRAQLRRASASDRRLVELGPPQGRAAWRALTGE